MKIQVSKNTNAKRNKVRLEKKKRKKWQERENERKKTITKKEKRKHTLTSNADMLKKQVGKRWGRQEQF